PSGNHRGLPSFPTRRSSDLRWLVHATVGIRRAGLGGGARTPRIAWTIDRKPGTTRMVNERLAGRTGMPRPTGGVEACPRSGVRPDRKSTRLHSSHVKISYAV